MAHDQRLADCEQKYDALQGAYNEISIIAARQAAEISRLRSALKIISDDAPRDEADIAAIEISYMQSSVPEDAEAWIAAAWARLHMARIARTALEQDGR